MLVFAHQLYIDFAGVDVRNVLIAVPLVPLCGDYVGVDARTARNTVLLAIVFALMQVFVHCICALALHRLRGRRRAQRPHHSALGDRSRAHA
eukprot:3296406-Alexandrium_andersonii.AAC.1